MCTQEGADIVSQDGQLLLRATGRRLLSPGYLQVWHEVAWGRRGPHGAAGGCWGLQRAAGGCKGLHGAAGGCTGAVVTALVVSEFSPYGSTGPFDALRKKLMSVGSWLVMCLIHSCRPLRA